MPPPSRLEEFKDSHGPSVILLLRFDQRGRRHLRGDRRPLLQQTRDGRAVDQGRERGHPLDADSLSADHRAHRATRVASDVRERTAHGASETVSRIEAGAECPCAGWSRVASLRCTGAQQRSRCERRAHVTYREWPEWVRGQRTIPLRSTKGKRTWSISGIPALLLQGGRCPKPPSQSRRGRSRRPQQPDGQAVDWRLLDELKELAEGLGVPPREETGHVPGKTEEDI